MVGLPFRGRGGTRIGAAGSEKGRDSIDCELTLLLRKLSKMEDVVGTRRNASDGRRLVATGDKYVDLKESIFERLKSVRERMSETSGMTAREQIETDAKIKRELRDIDSEWKSLQTFVRSEAKATKTDEDEMREREDLLLSLRREVDDLRNAHRSGYAHKDASSSRVVSFLPTHTEFPSSDGPPRPQEKITEEQQLRLEMIKRRDQGFDSQIQDIGRGVDALQEIARAQNQEVKKQNVMVDDLQQHIDNVQDHLLNVNAKMKTTLDKVGRSSDKLCVDIMCIMMLVGMLIVLYKLLIA